MIAALPAVAAAQPAGYPAKPVRVIIPFSAGGPVEMPARPVAQKFGEALEFITLAKANPGKLNYATSGVGSPRMSAARCLRRWPASG